MKLIDSAFKKSLIIIGTIADISAVYLLIKSTDFKNFKMASFITNPYLIMLIIITISIICLIIYWWIIRLLKKIEFLERQQKFIAAIITENNFLGRLNYPTRKSLDSANVTADDLVYFGYSKQQIQSMFPELFN